MLRSHPQNYPLPNLQGLRRIAGEECPVVALTTADADDALFVVVVRVRVGVDDAGRRRFGRSVLPDAAAAATSDAQFVELSSQHIQVLFS